MIKEKVILMNGVTILAEIDTNNNIINPKNNCLYNIAKVVYGDHYHNIIIAQVLDRWIECSARELIDLLKSIN